ncbi:MAG TPA: peptide chain release factor N(5)-glutamine methyltransferase [Coxiellaceae bacterium]|nr:MAG: protein-(glutamine-N5) methyltransferase, release factor-specific [Gammaproteobacteria bacterium RIFCSPHIGHO2_12_FULL_36_30]HLB55972.1 peptide chain release factor N(5)-glutamine methyltransferase [Coxiellaceae bacterium]
MNILEYRKIIAKKLSSISDSPQLDTELLFIRALKKTRTELLLCDHNELSEKNKKEIDDLIARRIKGEPIAYLLGTQPFWTMDLIVTADTLIPRPETECLVEWVLKNFKGKESIVAADLGAGTGAIAIALALENKNWKIDATDESFEALAVAKRNADKYAAKNISFYQGDWCSALPQKKYDVIISNPPYIAENDIHLEKLSFEPQSALVSGKNGLDAIEKIVSCAKDFLNENSFLVIEHGFDQAEAVCNIFKKNDFVEIKNHRDLADVPRFVTGKTQ